MSIDIELLKYPIGKFKLPESISEQSIHEAISTIKDFPTHLFSAVSAFSPAQLDTPYRPGGWTVRQLVHHCADSHCNAYVRFKLALTEENPTIKPYDEGSWAQLPDSKLPIEPSIEMIRAIHLRWGVLLESMTTEQFERTYFHPEKQKSQPLKEITFLYAWHSQHHLAHIQHLVIRKFDK